jgi:hypothetical protein
MDKIKCLWRGIFNYGQSIEKPIYRAAYTKKQAWKLMCDILAKKHGVHPSHVYALFDGHKDNFEITVETAYREVEDNLEEPMKAIERRY